MTQSYTRNSAIAVETPTTYRKSLNTDRTFSIVIEDISEAEATYIAQQLSLFVETHDLRPLIRVAETVRDCVDEDTEVFVCLSEIVPDDINCGWPVELEIEGVTDEETNLIMDGLGSFIHNPHEKASYLDLFEHAVASLADQPRSIVRLQKNDGSAREALEWHTDTNAEIESN